MIKIAIDGPAGAGKTSIAKRLADKLGFVYINTGALYRAIGLYALNNGIDPSDEFSISQELEFGSIRLEITKDQHVILNGEDTFGKLDTQEIAKIASDVSALPSVRQYLLHIQRNLADKSDCIMEGRDIGTVILPDADVKIFLTASPKARAERRCRQLADKGQPADFETVYAEIKERDFNDRHRKASPLAKADDAVLFNSTEKTLPQITGELFDFISSKIDIKKGTASMHSVFGKLNSPKPNARILLLTHNDLDGSGPVILLKSTFPKVKVKHCTASTADAVIRKELLSGKVPYDFIFITDISCSPETAERIQASPVKDRVVLMDHHQTAYMLNKYDWAVVTDDCPDDSERIALYNTDVERRKASATALVFDYLCYNNFLRPSHNMALMIAHVISCWDTWEWHDIMFDEPVCKNLNKLFGAVGAEHFEVSYIQRVTAFDRLLDTTIATAYDSLFDKQDWKMLSIELEKMKRHISYIRTTFRECDVTIKSRTYSAVFCLSDKFLSDTFDAMKADYPGKDLYVISGGQSVSLRSVKPEINVADIAAELGGGGHAGSAGIPVCIQYQKQFFETALGAKITLK